MAQTVTGLRAILSIPYMYKFLINLLGGNRSRYELVNDYIRPEVGMRILDLGCGPATILNFLPDGVVYVGVDLSQRYIDEANKKFGNRGEFYCKSVESFSESNSSKYDIVLGLGVLHHLDDSQVISFFKLASSLLNNKGRCFTTDPCFVEGQHPVARLLINLDRGRNVRTPSEYARLAKHSFSCVTQTVRHDRLRLPYTHHIMECNHCE
jgi:2-polyprenyl-3-methyl-5-hydroxy-6-metoxy-1,4-benzoquinol methylase